LIRLRLTSLLLKVQELDHAGPGEHAMAPPSTDFAKAESQNEPHQVREVDIADIAAVQAREKSSRLHMKHIDDAV